MEDSYSRYLVKGLCNCDIFHYWKDFFFTSRSRHTSWNCDWSSDVCSSDLEEEESDVSVSIDRATGQITAKKGDEDIDPEMLGRIAAQSAKQVMIQKIREAECNSVFEKY